MLDWVLGSIRMYAIQHNLTHRQVQRMFDTGIAAKQTLTAPMDGYGAAFEMAN